MRDLICPLLGTYCKYDKCAIWDKQQKKCAIAVLSTALVMMAAERSRVGGE